ncbi:MAG TPA: M20 family metallopeptidase [Candidatus Micrarchaeia archaeon]|nr:M20 family metallopeptidase [Candidatus Micrarchaeia archaeon]
MTEWVAAAVAAAEEQMVATRRVLHQEPELSFAEGETAGRIADRLREIGLAPRLLLDGTAVLCDLQGDGEDQAGGVAGPVMVRADIDALPIQERGEDRPYRSHRPGVMHACGHDGHMAIALGVAEVLAAHRADLPGRVRFCFQPAEEVAGGARRLIEAGALDPAPPSGAAEDGAGAGAAVASGTGVRAVVGLHLYSGLEVGTVGVRSGAIFASADEFTLAVRGRGGHGALPHLSLDPVPVAAAIVQGLQTLVSRETSPFEPAVVTIGRIEGGQAANIIAETVRLDGTVRAFDPDLRERLLRRVAELAGGIAGGAGATATFTRGPGCPPVVSDPRVARVVEAAARATLGATLVTADPLTVGDDMAEYCLRVPGCYFLLGAGNRSRGITAPHHHPEFDLDEGCLRIGAEVLTRATLALLRPDALAG